MGAVAAPVAAVSSLASIGFNFAGSTMKADAAHMRAEGINAADQFQADRAEQAAKFGRLQAELTDVTMRERLTTTLANIDAIRAADGIDASSPTTAAIEEFNRKVSDRQRMAAVVTARSQADSDEATASYLRQAGAYALAMGDKAANAELFAGGAQLFGSLAKGFG